MLPVEQWQCIEYNSGSETYTVNYVTSDWNKDNISALINVLKFIIIYISCTIQQ